MYVKGDILKPITPVDFNNRLNGLFHAAVVWDDSNDGLIDFKGIMLTHAPPSIIFDNILMSLHHFDSGFTFVYDDTHFVNQVLIKFESWGPFEKVGELTTNGISFLESNLTNLSSVDYISYKASLGI